MAGDYIYTTSPPHRHTKALISLKRGKIGVGLWILYVAFTQSAVPSVTARSQPRSRASNCSRAVVNIHVAYCQPQVAYWAQRAGLIVARFHEKQDGRDLYSILHWQKVLGLLVSCIVLRCVVCFHCCSYWLLFFVSCAFQPVVAVINHLLAYNRWKFLSNWICVICHNSSVNTSN